MPKAVGPRKDLGVRYTCFSCGTKFYDLHRPVPACPKCGADQREDPALKAPKPAERPAPRRPPPRPRRPSRSFDEEEMESESTDSEEEFDEVDDDLGDDDDSDDAGNDDAGEEEFD